MQIVWIVPGADRSDRPGCRSFGSSRVQIVRIAPGADRSDCPGCRSFGSSRVQIVQIVPSAYRSDCPSYIKISIDQEEQKMNGGSFCYEFGAGEENFALLCNLKDRNIFSKIF